MQADPHHSSLRQWLPIAGIAGGCLAAITVTFVIVLERGLTPPVAAFGGADLTEVQFSHLIDSDILGPGETVIMFHSSGLVSIDEAGVLLTDRRVVTYAGFNGQRLIRAAEYATITDVIVLERGNHARPTLIDIRTEDGGAMHISLSTRKAGDELFIAEIRRRMLPESVDTIVRRDTPR